ncbi:hypothetical protein RAZWK3B_09681 [Roseobacter sp. AzwK-3b]|uniref:hypothetical protein n=1 Tax=Roseobacter sp. AzwK-3b TaxID=351016 RepID=UPI0001568D26|nr:hypothetical protein [Roseobacter sp. AzwK-3b]EDM72512.1 hypothetical protein RAZWK3B_09681 [Roseobacter sp. AzwK-3b]
MEIQAKTAGSRILAAALAFGLAVSPANADFIDTTWTVEKFTGEAWFVQPEKVIGQTQMFDGGYAEGYFYSCDFKGQSMTYTTYANTEFFENPEFKKFIPLKSDMEADSDTLFVHRVTCNGNDLVPPRVLYPFVTNETRERAWYLYEGGIFALVANE